MTNSNPWIPWFLSRWPHKKNRGHNSHTAQLLNAAGFRPTHSCYDTARWVEQGRAAAEKAARRGY